MQRIILLAALSVYAAGCTTDAPNICKLGHLTDLPLTYRHVLLTPAFLDEQPTTMMLDTGAGLTIITRPTADRLGVNLQSTGGWVSGVGGQQALYAFTAKSFRIGELHGARLSLGVSAVGIDPHGGVIDGIFGSDFLSSYDIDFDLGENKLRLYKVLGGCNAPATNLEQPVYQADLERSSDQNDPRPHVRVIIGGIRLNAIVDSGAQRTSIFRNAARRLGLRLEDLAADHHDHAFGVGPTARDEVRHIMAPITIGEITISNLPVSIIDQRSDGEADMLLGLDFFARVHVWLSFHSHTLLMQYPPKPSPKLPDD